MKSLRSAAVFPSMVVPLCGDPCFAQLQSPHRVREQTLFREDEPLKRSVRLAPAVLQVLTQTKEVQYALEVDGPARGNPARFFRAAEVHLGPPSEVDLIVIGITPISGADNTWFWVVHSVRKQPKIVLFGGGNFFEVLKARTNGYKDITVSWHLHQRQNELSIVLTTCNTKPHRKN